MSAIDWTHDARLRSWVESANDPRSDFPIQNLPLAIFRRKGSPEQGRAGIAIGDRVLDLAACAGAGLLDVSRWQPLVTADALNPLMARGRPVARDLRQAAAAILRAGSPAAARAADITIALDDVELLLPARIGNYTDFYASIHHATNVGSMFRPDNPLLPNYRFVPIGYHGRASSIVASGTAIRRPVGQSREDASSPPAFGPSRRLDYEMELGAFVGPGNPLGQPIGIADAPQQLWGFCLVNDWSARDIQAWEYQPLGPFLSKNFATTISPWVVTLDALEPFRTAPTPRGPGEPAPLQYLDDRADRERGAFDVTVEVLLRSARMRQQGLAPFRVSRGSFLDLYWTVAQLLTHHASGGCNLQPGDLLASGTISGASKESRGCLLERTWRGTEPLELPTGERRTFLEDGDEVIMRGAAEREGFRRVGFGECAGVVVG